MDKKCYKKSCPYGTETNICKLPGGPCGCVSHTPKPLKGKSDAGANVPLDRLVMPYAVEQRLRFIDFLLSQYGHVNRSAIMDYFGIGAATATRDFKTYKGLCRDNVIYDDVDKSYHRSNRFKRVWA